MEYHYWQNQAISEVNSNHSAAFSQSLNWRCFDQFLWKPMVQIYFMWSKHELSPPKHNKPIVLNSTEMSGNNIREMIKVSSMASPGPQIVAIDSDSKEPTKPSWFGRQQTIIPLNLNNLSLPLNPFNVLATMAVANPTANVITKTTAPNNPSRRNRYRYRWTSAKLRDGRHHIQQRMTIHSTLLMSPG